MQNSIKSLKINGVVKVTRTRACRLPPDYHWEAKKFSIIAILFYGFSWFFRVNFFPPDSNEIRPPELENKSNYFSSSSPRPHRRNVKEFRFEKIKFIRTFSYKSAEIHSARTLKSGFMLIPRQIPLRCGWDFCRITCSNSSRGVGGMKKEKCKSSFVLSWVATTRIMLMLKQRFFQLITTVRGCSLFHPSAA